MVYARAPVSGIHDAQAWAKETLLSVSFLREGFYRLLVNIFIISFLIRYLRICSSKSPKIFKSIGSNLRNFLASLFAVASPLPSPEHFLKPPLL